jgi:hypothetical protein
VGHFDHVLPKAFDKVVIAQARIVLKTQRPNRRQQLGNPRVIQGTGF